MPPRPSAPRSEDLVPYVHKLLIAVAVAALALILLRWLHVFLLAFGASLVAVLLTALADPIRRRTPLDAGWSLGVTVAALIVLIAGVAWFVGAQVSLQLTQLQHALPAAWAAAQRQISTYEVGQWLLDRLHQASGLSMAGFGPIASRIGRITGSGLGAIAECVVVVVAGVYFAAQPQLYVGNLLKLVPSAAREAVTHTVEDIGVALRRWLVGTGLAMLTMGVLTAIGAVLLGLPAPLALGLLSGIAEFVPIVGAAVSALPALLLAVTLGPQTVAWTLLFYVSVHQFEGHVLIPLIQRRVVSVPPALTLFSVLAFGLLFGALGVVFATPLAVVLLVIVRRLYLHEPDTAAVASGKT
ncbi:AI-2E family transporter [Phenylobacterium hankyongense]|nr:AI-2E family transporter [Phenylobacterium hankyongense]